MMVRPQTIPRCPRSLHPAIASFPPPRPPQNPPLPTHNKRKKSHDQEPTSHAQCPTPSLLPIPYLSRARSRSSSTTRPPPPTTVARLLLLLPHNPRPRRAGIGGDSGAHAPSTRAPPMHRRCRQPHHRGRVHRINPCPRLRQWLRPSRCDLLLSLDHRTHLWRVRPRCGRCGGQQ